MFIAEKDPDLEFSLVSLSRFITARQQGETIHPTTKETVAEKFMQACQRISPILITLESYRTLLVEGLRGDISFKQCANLGVSKSENSATQLEKMLEFLSENATRITMPVWEVKLNLLGKHILHDFSDEVSDFMCVQETNYLKLKRFYCIAIIYMIKNVIVMLKV